MKTDLQRGSAPSAAGTPDGERGAEMNVGRSGTQRVGSSEFDRRSESAAVRLSSQAPQGYLGQFLDSLLDVSDGTQGRGYVFSGVSDDGICRRVTRSLAIEARRNGVSVICIDVTRSAGQLVLSLDEDSIRRRMRGGVEMPPGPLRVDVARIGGESARINEWLDRVNPKSDPVLLASPAITSSLDSARLALAFRGLILVADARRTTRMDLRRAASRARTVPCRILGVALGNSGSKVPSWLAALLGRQDTPDVLASVAEGDQVECLEASD